MTHLKTIKAPHWMCSTIFPGYAPPKSMNFWRRHLRGATGAVIAYDGKKIVGFLRWDNDHSQGTWVDPAYRKIGLARRMWKLMLRRQKPKRFTITTVTQQGKKFAEAIIAEHPEVEWELKAL